MPVSQATRRRIVFLVFIALVLGFYRFRWGILGLVNIGPLSQACENIEVLNTYLSTGGSPSAYLGRTPLIMCATEKENYEVVSKLIDLGVNVDAGKKRPYVPIIMDSSTGTTALDVSVRAGNFEITKLLFENGANVNWADNVSASPLNLTIVYNRPEFLTLFLENENTIYEFDESRIVGAALDGNLAIFRVLFEKGVHLERIHESALAGAASKNHIQLVNFLYEQGISVDAKNSRTGQTALHLPAKLNHVKMVEFLIDVKADINVRDNRGNTPLHYAAMSNHDEVAKILVDNGADTNLENKKGKTPLEVSIENDSWACETQHPANCSRDH
ncbi:ankyrin repeat domain-containing protein [Adonisia turfae]|uniref:Ankyrin repeat domain-containing protein n=1 Tax=Adonisia turfae CCMR0081 TaxID=2292702 RepID=A0A6M0RNJ9_9CYAN|nr:ankyrin repeat domain-containing protein [Adonisia turfae]NEZ57709.1 ankyrin repeat domain-containing protein [Adonisia turfae CCMR0081]